MKIWYGFLFGLCAVVAWSMASQNSQAQNEGDAGASFFMSTGMSESAFEAARTDGYFEFAGVTYNTVDYSLVRGDGEEVDEIDEAQGAKNVMSCTVGEMGTVPCLIGEHADRRIDEKTGESKFVWMLICLLWDSAVEQLVEEAMDEFPEITGSAERRAKSAYRCYSRKKSGRTLGHPKWGTGSEIQADKHIPNQYSGAVFCAECAARNATALQTTTASNAIQNATGWLYASNYSGSTETPSCQGTGVATCGCRGSTNSNCAWGGN